MRAKFVLNYTVEMHFEADISDADFNYLKGQSPEDRAETYSTIPLSNPDFRETKEKRELTIIRGEDIDPERMENWRRVAARNAELPPKLAKAREAAKKRRS